MDEEEAMAMAMDELGGDEAPGDILVKYIEDAHSGPGWYAWYTEYPEEGSIWLGDD